jgi:hypothetical protein
MDADDIIINENIALTRNLEDDDDDRASVTGDEGDDLGERDHR